MRRLTALPIARKDKLVVQDLADISLVYDQDNHKVHHLDPTVSLIWRHCDGKTRVEEVAELLATKLGVSSAEEAVWAALGQLEKFHLLNNSARRSAGGTV